MGAVTEAPILTSATLAELEEAVGRHDLELVARLAPGLTDAEMDDLMRPLGLTLPEEDRVWWRWHDGLTDQTFGPRFWLLPLEAAIREYHSRLEFAEGFGWMRDALTHRRVPGERARPHAGERRRRPTMRAASRTMRATTLMIHPARKETGS